MEPLIPIFLIFWKMKNGEDGGMRKSPRETSLPQFLINYSRGWDLIDLEDATQNARVLGRRRGGGLVRQAMLPNLIFTHEQNKN